MATTLIQLIRNWTDGERSAACAWVVGDAAKDSYVIQTNNIRNGLLFPYNTSIGSYKCPADRTRIVGSQVPRVRSYSISTAMNWYNSGAACDNSAVSHILIWKSPQISNPGHRRPRFFGMKKLSMTPTSVLPAKIASTTAPSGYSL